MKNSKVYQTVKAKYSDEEIVDSLYVPADLSVKEEKELEEDIRKIRIQKLNSTTEQDRMIADVMRLRFQIEHYVKRDSFSYDQTFGKYLEEYIRIMKKPKKQIAEDLAIHYTKLSRIIHDVEEPSVELSYRLEKHAGYLIKAELWWSLLAKKQAFVLSKDEKTRKAEQEKVKNLYSSFKSCDYEGLCLLKITDL